MNFYLLSRYATLSFWYGGLKRDFLLAKHFWRRTVAEPRIISRPRNSTAYEEGYKRNDFGTRSYLGLRSVPLGELLSLQSLSTYLNRRSEWDVNATLVPSIEILPLRDYHARTRRRLDQLILFSRSSNSEHKLRDQAGRELNCDPSGCITHLGPAQVELFGDVYTVAQVTCWPHNRGRSGSAQQYRSLLHEAVNPLARHVAVMFTRGILWSGGGGKDFGDLKHEREYSAMVRASALNESLQLIAQRLVHDMFANRSFLSIHWRRGDRGHKEMGGTAGRWTQTSPAKTCWELCRALGIERLNDVFLMTNSGEPSEIQQIERLECHPNANVRRLPADLLPGWQNEQHRMVIEQAIAVQAEAFMVSAYHYYDASTVSRHIIERRMAATNATLTQSRSNTHVTKTYDFN